MKIKWRITENIHGTYILTQKIGRGKYTYEGSGDTLAVIKHRLKQLKAKYKEFKGKYYREVFTDYLEVKQHDN